MIGLLVVAHEPLAQALLDCARHVFGSDPPHCIAFDVPAEADPLVCLDEARALHAEVDKGDGVLVLTDMFGGTPTNIAAQLARPRRTAVLTGVNLPMLLRAINYRADIFLDALVEKACHGGTSGVMRVGSTAHQNQRHNPPPPHSPDQADPEYDALIRRYHQQ